MYMLGMVQCRFNWFSVIVAKFSTVWTRVTLASNFLSGGEFTPIDQSVNKLLEN